MKEGNQRYGDGLEAKVDCEDWHDIYLLLNSNGNGNSFDKVYSTRLHNLKKKKKKLHIWIHTYVGNNFNTRVLFLLGT